MKILQAIAEVSQSVGKIQKTGKNPHFKSEYMTLIGIRTELDIALSEHGLILQQYVEGSDLVTIVFIKDQPMSADTALEIKMPLIGAGNMQQIGSAITYARRYSVVALFGILDKDDDGEQAVGRDAKELERVALEKELFTLIKTPADFNTLKDELGMGQIANSKDMNIPQLKKMIEAKKKESK